MLSALLNSWKIKELRGKILFTMGVIVLCRLAANIPCPGIDTDALAKYIAKVVGSNSNGAAGQVMGIINIFSGGAMNKFAIAALGIMPYISASIVMQLLTPVLPNLERLQREGEPGQKKIKQYTRYLTLIICIFQGAGLAKGILSPQTLLGVVPDVSIVSIENQTFFVVMTTVILVCGTMIYMWLGEQITDRGIGNGVSIIIMVNIIARMPEAIGQLIPYFDGTQTIGGMQFKSIHGLIFIAFFAAVTSLTILLNTGQRRISIQMARSGIGNKIQGGSTYLPLKVNFPGVMPIIFAGPIIQGLMFALGYIPFVNQYLASFRYGSMGYITVYAFLVVVFSYFWVANMFNPIRIAENLKQQGAYIPGIRPGEPTSKFLDNTMSRITFLGAVFLTLLAIVPMVISDQVGISSVVTSFFGGTSLIIMVGVIIDTFAQIESHLVMENYDGFLNSGSLQARTS